MKKLILLTTLFFASNSHASDVCDLQVPKDCEYLNSEFSTGGADSVSYLMEYDCKRPDGSIVKYQTWEFSVAGMMGFGRYFAPKQINFVKSTIEGRIALKCK